MDRKGQLRNVAFGGAWSEQIAAEEELRLALAVLERAVDRSVEEDLREDAELAEALVVASKAHPKGRELAASYRKAMVIEVPGYRVQELSRIQKLLMDGVAKRIER